MQGENERLLKRWREIIDHVRGQLGDLLWQREQIRRISKMIDGNPRLLKSDKPFLWDALRWYMFFAVMRVRSQADKGEDVYSLRRVLEEIREHPEFFSRDYALELVQSDGHYRGSDFEQSLTNSIWKQFRNDSGDFDTAALDADIRHLEDISRDVRKLANKSIAHVTKQGVLNEPQLTFNGLDECIDAFEAITMKYITLLTGGGYATLLPTEQFDWYEQFTFAWKPRIALTPRWPDPWPQTDEEVRQWKLTDPYDHYFTNRANRVEELFNENPESIDGMALVVIALGTLAEFRFAAEVPRGNGKEQQCFRLLLTQHCPSFVNRMSIPELARHARHDPAFASFEKPITDKYPIYPMNKARVMTEDPLIEDFHEWADKQNPVVPPKLRFYDYAGCIYRLYRNSVVHELRIGKGRDPSASLHDDPEDYPVFYANVSNGKHPMEADPVEYMRFGIHGRYLLHLLREAIASLREWALRNDRDIIPKDD